MIPYPSSALSMLSGRLMNHLLPDLKTEYGMSDGMLVGLLMNALAEELESGIDARLKDVAEMHDLLVAALDAFARNELPQDIEALSEAAPADFTMKTVNEFHDRMTRVLIAIHAATETRLENERIKALNGAIWGYLERQAERHRITAAG